MADMEMLYTALRNADAAGDTQGAATLATYIKSLQSSTPVATPPVQTGPKILPETDTSSDFFRGIGNYPGQTESLLGSIQTVGGLAAQKMGFEDTGKGWIKSGLGKIAEGEHRTTSKASDEFTEAWEKGIGTVLTDWLPYQVGAGAANILESLAFSALGAGVGALTGAGAGAVPGAAAGLVSKTLVKKGIKEAAEEVLRKETAKAIAEGATKESAKDAGKVAAKAFVESEAKRVIPELVGKETFAAGAQEYGKAGAKKLGSYAGTATQAVSHGLGEVGQQAIKAAEERGEGIEDVDLGRVLPAAAVHAVADFVNERIGLGALKIGDAASKRLVTEIAKRIAVTGLKETGGEEIQSIAERYGAKLSLTDADALKDYINTAAASFGMAVAPGAIGGFRTHLNQQLQNRPALPGEPEIETEEQKKTKAGKPITTIDQLKSIVEGETIIPIVPKTKSDKEKLTAEGILNDYPEGKEGEFPSNKSIALVKILKDLGIEKPVADKAKGESFRVLAIQAMRDHYAKKYAAQTATGVTEEELEDVPDFGETKPPVEEVKPPAAEIKPPVEEVKPPVDEVKPPAAAPVKITPAQQKTINDLQGEIDRLTAKQVSPELVQEYIDLLNEYKTSIGITTTTLSAKAKTSPEDKTRYFYKNAERISELQAQLDQARSTGESQRQINKLRDALEEEKNKPKVVTIADQQEEAVDPLDVEAVRAKLARDKAQQEQDEAEAREKSEPVYYQQNLPKHTEELYDDNREQANAQIREENKQLESLTTQREALAKQLVKSKNKLADLDRKSDDSSLDESDKVAAEIKTAEAQLKSIDEAIEKNGPWQTLIPEWGQLDSDEKDVYFGHIKKNSLWEHATAANALREYIKQLNKRNEGYGKKETKQKLTAEDRSRQGKARRAALAYDENREGYGLDFSFKFPRWADLSEAAKNAFLSKVIRTSTDPVTGKKTFVYTGAGILEKAGFIAAGIQLNNEAKDISEAAKKKSEDNFKLIQQQIALEARLYEERRAKHVKETQRFNETNQKAVPLVQAEGVVPNRIAAMVKDGNLKGILQYLRTLGEDQKKSTLGVKIFRQIAQTIFSMDLKTKIHLVDSLPGGDLAIYDPVKDAIYVTAEGLTNNTLLHEVVHAATVKVLDLFTANKGARRHLLTEGQRRAAQHLIDLMNATKGLSIQEDANGNPITMGLAHPEAYSNVFEFVAYALTDEDLKADLASVELELSHTVMGLGKSPVESILPRENKSGWSAFKLAIAEMLGMDKLFAKSGKPTTTSRKNFLMEVSAAFEDILSVPTEPIYLEANLPAKGNQKKPPLKAAEPRTGAAYEIPEEVAPKSFTKWLSEKLFTPKGHSFLEYKFQNKRAVLRKLYEQLAKSRLVIYTGEKINDIYGQITTSVADAKNYFNRYIDQDLTDLNSSIGRFARAANLSTKKALEVLHPYLEALHEPERRLVKYLLTVPLVPAADAKRKLIIRALDTQTLDKEGAKFLRDTLDSIVFAKDAQGNFITDATGKRTLTNNVEIKKGKQFHDIDNANYNATGLTTEESTKFRNDPLIKEHQAEVDNIVKAMQKLAKSTTELNKIGHFWSHLVDNRVNFYGWENYVPLKGYQKQSAVDEMLDFDGKKMGADLQEKTAPFEGRTSTSNNPILQMAADATRSAIRAGQRNLTLSIKNSLNKSALNPNGQNLIDGEVINTISFEDRNNEDLLKEYQGENNIFHYNDDGTIDILRVKEKNLRESIRQTFQASAPLIEKANLITGAIAQGHTRYNYNFGPMNFVRDALTNAFVIGAEMGPAKAAGFIKAMTAVVVNGGMYKAMQVAILYRNGHDADIKRLEQMAKTDTFVEHMYELIKQGGMVTHLSGLSLKSQLQDLQKEIGQSGVMQKKEQFDKFVDTWTNMFEIASRTSAYMVAKQNYKTENLARKMGEKQAEAEASARAVRFSKNLANFEQVGEWGKAMGALYMFFRPSATGAARSLQAVAPAFTSLASAVEALPDAVKNNPAALETFKKNYSLQKRNAQIMVSSLIALGFFAHTMSKMMAPDDDLGRNAVDTDDMDRWVRYARFHIPNGISTSMGLGKDVVFQMPWGMGLGAFAAAGAQLSAIYDGKTPLVKGLANIFGSVALDSFVPIPISKMPITDNPISFLLDSIAPSMVRPALEFALNKNGLGQAIHNDQSRRMGDAYTGGDNIPQIYKDASRGIANATVGDFDWNPNTLYFLTNTYMDGPGRVIETLYGINDLAQRRKDFSPKTDIPLMGSFFGTKVNIDAQQFSNIENKIKHIEGIMKEFATNPEMEAKYAEKHPLHDSVVKYYNKELAPLNELRKEANEYRLNQYLTPKERSELLKLNTMQANVMKNQMIEVFKAYDIKP